MYLRSSLPTYDNLKRLQRKKITDDIRKSTNITKMTQNRHHNERYLNEALHLILANLISPYMFLIRSLSSYDDSTYFQRREITDNLRKSTNITKITHYRHHNERYLNETLRLTITNLVKS